MHNLFSLSRFVRLFRKTVMERPLQLFGSMALMLLGSLLIYGFFARFIMFGAAQNLGFTWGLFGGGSFVASLVFNYFTNNAMGSSYLTLPASALEKWLCGILLVGIIYPLVFCLFFRGIDLAFIQIYHHGLDPKLPDFSVRYNAVYPFGFDRPVAKDSFAFFFICAGSMLAGSLFFNKASFIKVAFIIIGVCIGLIALHFLIAKSLFPQIVDAFPFQGVQVKIGTDDASLNLSEHTRTVLQWGMVLLCAVLWTIPLIRLREKEF